MSLHYFICHSVDSSVMLCFMILRFCSTVFFYRNDAPCDAGFYSGLINYHRKSCIYIILFATVLTLLSCYVL